jgi:putative ABC transport system ATP-binding protein
MTTEPASGGLSQLGAEAQRGSTSYGEGALVMCDRLVRIYATDGVEVQALQGLDLLIDEGELTAIVGASGSGKSTLMNILAGLDSPSAGRARVAGHDLAAMGARERLAYRRSAVGFVWQQTARNLLPYLTGLQNVILPMKLAGMRRRARAQRAGDLLDALAVGYCAGRKPVQMSGGEQQRIAIATALANEPEVLLADEPTGELDSETAREVFAAFQTANTELGVTVLVVTHDPAVSAQVRRTIAIRDGRTSTETLRHDVADEQGNASRHAVEYAVLDRAGRVQLPREMTEALGMKERVLLEQNPDHIGVWPGQADRGQAPRDPADRGQAPRDPADRGQAPRDPAGPGQAPRDPAGPGQAPRDPADRGQAPRDPAGPGQAPRDQAGRGQ